MTVLRRIVALLAAQCISASITFSGVFSQMLTRYFGIHTPYLQLMNAYMLIWCIYLPLRLVTANFSELKKDKLRIPKLLLLSIIDVEANFLAVTSYRFTILSSVMFIGCLAIPSTMTLSFIILKRRFTVLQVLGAISCVLGVIFLVIADSEFSRGFELNSRFLIGDALAIMATLMYSVANVYQEWLLRNSEVITIAFSLGFFGFILSGIQTVIFEFFDIREAIFSVHTWQTGVAALLCYSGFASALFIVYSSTPVVITISSAVTINISMLTSDIYGVILSVILFGKEVSD